MVFVVVIVVVYISTVIDHLAISSPGYIYLISIDVDQLVALKSTSLRRSISAGPQFSNYFATCTKCWYCCRPARCATMKFICTDVDRLAERSDFLSITKKYSC